ncbi:hypothetical protein ABT025_02645 [Streptomyces sp. NPDC002809]|uniref:hypothetical protein n=1 Tax=Streptomyces sp. NPDC002809 TaxID=3154433 RepID=UPI00332F57BF
MRIASAAVGTALVASALVAGPVTTASAAPLICDPGSRSVSWVTTSHSRVLTHAPKGLEKEYSGGKKTYSKTVTHEKTLSSSWSVTGGASAGFSVAKVLASLDAHVEGSYTHSKGHTTTKSITVTDELTKKGRYWFYAGRLKASGYWQGFRCDRGTKWIEQAHGTAKTYGALVEGTTRCGEKVSKKSIANLVQKKYC